MKNVTKHLRDEFAIAALAGGLQQGLLDHNFDCLVFWGRPDTIAKRAYAIADAMLKVRREGGM